MEIQRIFHSEMAILGWAVLLHFLMLPTYCSANSKQVLTTGVFLPNHAFFRRKFVASLKKTLGLFNQDYNFQISKYYRLTDNPIILDDHATPAHVLDEFCNKILEKGANTIIYISNKGEQIATAQYVLQLSNFLGIPVLTWNGDNAGSFQPTAESIILQMAPSVRHESHAMMSLLKRYDWKSFSVVTGTLAGQDFFIDSLRDLVDKYEPSGWFEIMSVIKIHNMDPHYISAQLDKLSATDTRVILFYASKKEADKVLPIAQAKGLTGKEYIWVVSKAVTVTTSMQQKEKDYPIGTVGIYYKTDRDSVIRAIQNAITVWVHGLESMLTDKLNQGVQTDFIPRPNISCSSPKTNRWKYGQVLYNYLRNVSVSTNKPPIQFTQDGSMTDTELKIVNLDTKHYWEQIGTWNSKTGLSIDDITWPGDAATAPRGRPSKYQLKVVTIQEKPYVVYSDPDKTGSCSPMSILCRIRPLNETLRTPNATTNSSLYQCCSGLTIDILRKLSSKIGFEIELFEVEDKKWGAYDKENNEWNGLVKTLMDHKADMCVTSLKITPDRAKMIDFSVPFLETGITILVAVRDGVISPTAFLEPFDIMSWTFILVMCIHVTAVAVFLFEWLSPCGYDTQMLPRGEPYDYPSWCLILVFSVHASGAAIFIFEWLSPSGLDRGNKAIREHRFSLFRSFWLIWAMLFGAAVNVDNPRGVSSRFMANIWALFAVVFTASYTANLAAFMITKQDYDKLTGIRDWRLNKPLSHKPPYKFATVPDGSTETNLRNHFPEMYQYMRQFNKTRVSDGVQAVKDRDIHAFLYDATVLEYLAAHDDGCKLRTVGTWHAMTGYGIAFPQGSKWKTVVNKYLLKFINEGEMERLQKFWLGGACSQKSEEGESSSSLGILNFTSAFILLAGGMLLGGLLLLLEHFYFKFMRVKLRKLDKCGCCGLISLSMGRSLTFEQSVREAMEMHKNFHCKNPICETQIWKVKHELDLALLKIERLEKQMGANGIMPERRGVWQDDHLRGSPPAIGWKKYVTTPPRKTDAEPPASIGFTQEVMPPYPCPPPPLGQVDMDRPPYRDTGQFGRRSPSPCYRQEALRPSRHRSLGNKKGSRSLPSSPVKRQLTSPIWRPERDDTTKVTDGPMKRTISFPNTRSVSPGDRKPGDKKTRYHKGAYYEEVDTMAVAEKETVL